MEPAPGPELDALAAILRALAQHAGGRPGAAAQLEAWARHVLVLAPPPGRSQWRSERDWLGLRRFVVSHLRETHASSTKALGDLRDVLWALIDGMSRALTLEATEDRTVAESLARLREAAAGPPEELKRTALETVSQVASILEEKATRHRSLARELGMRVELLHEELDEARREAELDGLTQLRNRASFDRELERALQLGALTGEPYVLVLVDVDRFKGVNDGFGHPVGDEALRAVANVLALAFPRRSDVVCRYGGDEFAVLLRDTDAADAQRLVTRFLGAIRELRVEGLAALELTVSAGIAEQADGDTPEAWLARADAALYEAKSQGRDRARLAHVVSRPPRAA